MALHLFCLPSLSLRELLLQFILMGLKKEDIIQRTVSGFSIFVGMNDTQNNHFFVFLILSSNSHKITFSTIFDPKYYCKQSTFSKKRFTSEGVI